MSELLQRNGDGIFLSISSNTYEYHHLKEIKKQEIRLILFDRISKSVPTFRIIIDNQKAGFKATDHLIKQGCKNITHFRGNLIPQISIDRFIGYKKTLNNTKFLTRGNSVLCVRKTVLKVAMRMPKTYGY